MRYMDCFRLMAKRRTDQLVVTSAGNSSQAWWAVSKDSERSFYLDASMSLSTLFASGMAMACPNQRFWAFMGDGAFCMNPGMLMVERQMNLPNLVHMVVSNRAYGGTSNAALPNSNDNDYAAIARAMGLQRTFTFTDLKEMESGLESAITPNAAGHTFVVLEVEPFDAKDQALPQPPFDGPEMKYRFGRELERLSGRDIFGYRV
jgi:thiamine pyrophosphate-dependent acetolactate synthase large subunit-like protein